MQVPYVPAPDDGGAYERARKFRQAAFVYLHLGVLYEAGVWVAWRQGVVALGTAVVLFWLVAGAGIVALVFWALWSKRLVWVARAVWVLGLLRVPALLRGAFFEDGRLPPGFYLAALVVVLVNLWFLARAGWDL